MMLITYVIHRAIDDHRSNRTRPARPARPGPSGPSGSVRARLARWVGLSNRGLLQSMPTLQIPQYTLCAVIHWGTRNVSGHGQNRTYGERRIRVGFRASKGELQAFMLIDTRISLDSNPTKYQQSIECSEHTKPRICGTSARAPPGRPRPLRSALRALPCPESPVPPAARAASS